MKIYQLGDKQIAVIEGDVYLKLSPQEAEGGGALEAIPKTAKIQRKKRGTKVKEVKELLPASGGPRARRGRMASEKTEQIIADINSGMDSIDVARKHEVPISKIYNLKFKLKKEGKLLAEPDDEESEEKEPKGADLDDENFEDKFGTGPALKPKIYQCVRGHQFKTTVPRAEAKCPEPNCAAKVFREIIN